MSQEQERAESERYAWRSPVSFSHSPDQNGGLVWGMFHTEAMSAGEADPCGYVKCLHASFALRVQACHCWETEVTLFAAARSSGFSRAPELSTVGQPTGSSLEQDRQIRVDAACRSGDSKASWTVLASVATGDKVTVPGECPVLQSLVFLVPTRSGV